MHGYYSVHSVTYIHKYSRNYITHKRWHEVLFIWCVHVRVYSHRNEECMSVVVPR